MGRLLMAGLLALVILGGVVMSETPASSGIFVGKLSDGRVVVGMTRHSLAVLTEPRQLDLDGLSVVLVYADDLEHLRQKLAAAGVHNLMRP